MVLLMKTGSGESERASCRSAAPETLVVATAELLARKLSRTSARTDAETEAVPAELAVATIVTLAEAELVRRPRAQTTPAAELLHAPCEAETETKERAAGRMLVRVTDS